ncbi:MAG: hypothetical protein KGH75_09905 [Rhodospirillales bacterium]|nr:hypothetical protein [Rhodospirillales bacterium]
MSDIKDGDKIVVWFSCGAASAVAAKRTIEKYGSSCDIRIVNNPIAEEHADNRRFLKDVEKWLGKEIEIATNIKWPSFSAQEVWEKKKYMSGRGGAPCTGELKKKARQQWEANNSFTWLVLGFTFEEQHRAQRFKLFERSNLLPILIDEQISKDQCFEILALHQIELPEIYKLGYPNANCIGCVKASSSTYWNHVRKMHPEIFDQRSEQSRRLGARLVYYKGKRIFLDELPEDAKGRKMKNLDIECGIFCEEKP